MNIIQWCNDNTGFATILLSTLTLITSIVAIVVSIKTAKLPYKKKININTFFVETEDDEYDGKIFIMNTGNRTIGIINISIEYNNNLIYGSEDLNEYIKPSEVYEHALKFKQNQIGNASKKIVISILDTEQKEYIFKQHFGVG